MSTTDTNKGIGYRYRKAAIHNMDVYMWVAQKIKNQTVIDLGCGRGDGLLIMSFYAGELIGVDIDKSQLKMATRHNYFCRTNLVELDLNGEFPSREVDAITAFEVLEHLEDPKEVFQLTNWKTFYFSVPKDQPHPLHKWVFSSPEDIKKIIPMDEIEKMEIELVNNDYRVTLWK